MAYGLYNPNEKHYKPKFWLAKPNKQIITRLKEIDETASLQVDFGKVNEVQFKIPYHIEKNNQTVVNPHIDLIHAKYLLKMEFQNEIEWFVIESYSKEVAEEDSIPATAYSLQHELTFKKIYEIEVTSVLPVVIINQVLDKTGWKAGYIDPILAAKYRSYTFSNTSSLDCLYQIATTTNGILQFDTVNQTVDLYDEETLSQFNGLVINDKNYLESLTDEKGASEIVTRLFPIGNEGLTINRHNPTGTSYLEDFSFFLFPFERNAVTKETIKSSNYFTDELSHATLDYQDLIKSKEGALKENNDQKDVLQTDLLALKNKLSDDELSHDKLKDITDIMKVNREYAAKSTLTAYEEMDLREGTYFSQMRVQHGTADLWVNDKKYTLTSEWQSVMIMLYEDKTVLYEAENFSDTSNNGIQFYMARIPATEESWTHDQLAEKYNAFILEATISLQKELITAKEAEITDVTATITAIHNEISIANNFTPEQIKERERYIYEEYWVEDNHVDAKELYEDAVQKFKTINHPSTTMNLDIINFLSMTSEIRNWDKLLIGSKLRVHYSRLKIESESILIGINYDFENKSISLTVSDTKDLLTDEEKLVNMLYSTSSSSNYLALKKFIYDDAVQKTNAVEELLNETWDATARRIVAGVNESVEIGKRGIVIRNPAYPDDILVAQAGVLAISNDGGLSFKNALTTEGLVAERIVGKLLIGQKLWIEDENGIITLMGGLQEIKDNTGATRIQLGEYEEGKYGMKVYDGSIEFVNGLPKTQIEPTAVDAWDSAEANAKKYADDNAVMTTKQYNGVSITPESGFVAERTDLKSKATMNATEGFSMESRISTTEPYQKVFFVDSEGNGTFAGVIKGSMIYLGGTENQNGIMQVMDANGDLSAEINGGYIGAYEMNVGHLDAPNKVEYANYMGQGLTFYVSPVAVNGVEPSDENSGTEGWSAPLMTIGEAINRIPKSFDGNVRIILAYQTSIYEDIMLAGFTGNGRIIINNDGDYNPFYGTITAQHNTASVEFEGLRVNSTGSYTAFDISSCYADIKRCVINGAVGGTTSALLAGALGVVNIQNSEVHNVDYAVRTTVGASVNVSNVTGTANRYAFQAFGGGLITGTGSAPTGSLGNGDEVAGGLIRGSWSFPAPPAKPAPATVEITKTWYSASSSGTWRSDYGGLWDTGGNYGNTVTQGYWNGFGRFTGSFFFGSSPSTAVTGKNIKRIRIQITRLSGGTYSSQDVRIRPHTSTTRPAGNVSIQSPIHLAGIKVGETRWITLPSSFYAGFESGAYKGLSIDASSTYVKLEKLARLEICYE